MRAAAGVTVEADADGVSRVTTLRSDPPLLFRLTGEGVHLMGGAAGPLGGDRLRIEIEVGPGAELTIATVAATMLLPGAGRSELEIVADVGAGGRLVWLPEPTISVARSTHRQMTTITMAADADLSWSERLVLGRTGEPSGQVDSTLRVVRAGVVVTHQQHRLGPDVAPGWDGAAVVGGHTVVNTHTYVGYDPSSVPVPTAGSGRSQRFELAADAWVDTGLMGDSS